jgi:hypothetical protein
MDLLASVVRGRAHLPEMIDDHQAELLALPFKLLGSSPGS